MEKRKFWEVKTRKRRDINVSQGDKEGRGDGMVQLEAAEDSRIGRCHSTLVMGGCGQVGTDRSIPVPKLAKATGRKFNDLPNDIIYNLLDLAEGEWKLIFRMATVNRRMRVVALGMSGVWASITLTDMMEPEMIDVIVGRAGSKGLKIEIDECSLGDVYGGDRRENGRAIATLFRYSYRWCEARICASMESMDMMNRNFADSEMDNLDRLFIARYWMEYTPNGKAVYSRWKLPMLTCIQDDTFFAAFIRKELAPRLKVCDLTVFDKNANDFLEFLSSAYEIEDLAIQDFCRHGVGKALDRRVVLLNVKRLVVDTCGRPELPFLGFRSTIRTESVTTLYVRFDFWSWHGGSEMIDRWRWSLESLKDDYPLLKDFTFIQLPNSRVSIVDVEITTMFFVEDILLQLPSTIRKIFVKTRTVAIETSKETMDGCDVERIFELYRSLILCEVSDMNGQRSIDLKDCGKS